MEMPITDSPSGSMLHINEILAFASQKRASDVHLCEGEHVAIRIEGHLDRLVNTPVMTRDMIHAMILQLCYDDQKRVANFIAAKDIDFSYVMPDGTPFRVNLFFTLGRMGAVLRRIEREAKTLSDIKLPPGVNKILTAKQGLFLVTGPTGSGKSTTIVAILEQINKTRDDHIITIEDPIEFIFTNKKSTFSQREIGRDSESFMAAIRGAMREDPNIVFVGEMRDTATVEAAVNLAETGHLVFSTLHTSGSVQTLARIIQFFPADIQDQVRIRLGDSLLGVLSQRLLPQIKDGTRIPVHELMLITPAIRNLIKSGDLVQVNNNIELGTKEGMMTMRASCERLQAMGLVRREDWIGYFTNNE